MLYFRGNTRVTKLSKQPRKHRRAPHANKSTREAKIISETINGHAHIINTPAKSNYNSQSLKKEEKNAGARRVIAKCGTTEFQFSQNKMYDQNLAVYEHDSYTTYTCEPSLDSGSSGIEILAEQLLTHLLKT